MAVTEADKSAIIKEYEQQQELEMLKRRCKVKPLHDARVHFDNILKERNLYWKGQLGYYETRLYHDVDDAIWKAFRNAVCERYDLGRITDLRAEDYKKANEWAIKMIDKIFGSMSS